MKEDTAAIAIQVLNEVLAKEKMYPKQERSFEVLKRSNYVVPYKFGIDYMELSELMRSFEAKGLLKITSDYSLHNPNKGLEKETILFDVIAKDSAQKRISYEIKNFKGIQHFIGILKGSVGNGEKEASALYYNETTGIGRNGTENFKLKDGSSAYKVFKFLYKKPNKKMYRYDVLVQCGFYEDGEAIDKTKKTLETAKINALAKSLRSKIGLNSKNLVNNRGNLTLVMNKTPIEPKSPPNST